MRDVSYRDPEKAAAQFRDLAGGRAADNAARFTSVAPADDHGPSEAAATVGLDPARAGRHHAAPQRRRVRVHARAHR